jgi:hypothetical protein
MELSLYERLPFTVANGIPCSEVVAVTTVSLSPTSIAGTMCQSDANDRAVQLIADLSSSRGGCAFSLASATSKGERSEPISLAIALGFARAASKHQDNVRAERSEAQGASAASDQSSGRRRSAGRRPSKDSISCQANEVRSRRRRSWSICDNINRRNDRDGGSDEEEV